MKCNKYGYSNEANIYLEFPQTLSAMLATCSSTTQRNLLLKGKRNTDITQSMFKNFFFTFTHSIHRKRSTQKLLNYAEIYFMSCTNCLCNKSLFRNFKNSQFRHHVTWGMHHKFCQQLSAWTPKYQICRNLVGAFRNESMMQTSISHYVNMTEICFPKCNKIYHVA